MMNLTLKAYSHKAYGFNHRYYNQDYFVLKGRRKENTSVSSRRMNHV